jgi:DNA-binding CsgD family transcriptional regulator
VAVTIGSPWYRTTWAYVLYGLLVLAALYLNYRWQQHQLKRQKVQLEANARVSRRLAAAAEEQENLQKRYGMLETGLGEVKKQLRSKTIELARKAKENDEKGRILQSLKEKVDGLLAQRGNTGKFEWQKVSRILENFPDTEDNSFSLQLEELHQGFLTTLSQRFTDLTTYDLRLCAYLKSGLTTREIAELMNVLPSSVNVSRSRLRKKLELAPKEDLFRFLRGVE